MRIRIIGRWGAFPGAGEATASYLLESGSHKILLDCGSGALAALQRFVPLYEVTAAFISHRHYDHIADLGSLQYACLIDTDLKRRQRPLRILMASESSASGIPEYNGSHSEGIAAGDVLELEDGLRLSFFRTNHDAYCLGVRVEAEGKVLVYTADTRYDESLLPAIRDADLLITESSFYAGFDAAKFGHMNAPEAGRLAAKACAKRLVLSHLPHFGDIQSMQAEAEEEFGGEVTVAEFGLELEV